MTEVYVFECVCGEKHTELQQHEITCKCGRTLIPEWGKA